MKGGDPVAKVKITDLVEKESAAYLTENGLELYLTEYVKEGKDWYLRIYIDKEGGVNIQDCEDFSRYISERLDALDPIERNYYLEVSSPGMDRPLVKDSHFTKYTGSQVDISLYKAVNGTKQLTGILKGLEDDKIAVDIDGEALLLERSAVTRVRLSVII